MLGKKKDNAEVTPSVEEAPGQKKGRPTPTRKQAQARTIRPLIPADRKAAKKAAREQRNQAYQREQDALRTGNERYMPAAHRGPQRRFIRDWVDARWSLSEFIVPVMLLFLVGLTAIAFLQPGHEVARLTMTILSGTFYGLFFLSIIEGFFVWRKIKRELTQKFSRDDIPRGGWFYMYSRMVMARRWRTPSAMVTRGDYPG